MRTSHTLLAVLAGAAIACSNTEQPPPQTAAEPAARQTPPPATSPTRSVVNIAPEIRKACGIQETDAHFAFDSAQVQSPDYPTLNKLVTCFSSGPLAGRDMRLVGHADPRGGEEYNLVLGGSRADGVKAFLVGHGLPGTRIATSSRGEMDAKGIDERTWADDRRVDVRLAN